MTQNSHPAYNAYNC